MDRQTRSLLWARVLVVIASILGFSLALASIKTIKDDRGQVYYWHSHRKLARVFIIQSAICGASFGFAVLDFLFKLYSHSTSKTSRTINCFKKSWTVCATIADLAFFIAFLIVYIEEWATSTYHRSVPVAANMICFAMVLIHLYTFSTVLIPIIKKVLIAYLRPAHCACCSSNVVVPSAPQEKKSIYITPPHLRPDTTIQPAGPVVQTHVGEDLEAADFELYGTDADEGSESEDAGLLTSDSSSRPVR